MAPETTAAWVATHATRHKRPGVLTRFARFGITVSRHWRSHMKQGDIDMETVIALIGYLLLVIAHALKVIDQYLQ